MNCVIAVYSPSIGYTKMLDDSGEIRQTFKDLRAAKRAANAFLKKVTSIEKTGNWEVRGSTHSKSFTLKHQDFGLSWIHLNIVP